MVHQDQENYEIIRRKQQQIDCITGKLAAKTEDGDHGEEKSKERPELLSKKNREELRQVEQLVERVAYFAVMMSPFMIQ